VPFLIPEVAAMKLSPRSLCLGLAALGLAVLAAPRSAQGASAALPADIATTKTITFCSSLTLPPLEFLSATQQPEGSDIDLGNALAKRLGLQVKWVNMPFAGLVPNLLAGHCDAVLSGLFIKPERLKVINQIPYMYAREGFLLKTGVPQLSGPEALSGEKAATVTGTMATDLLNRANIVLQKDGKKPVTIVMFPDNVSALQQVQFGQVAAYGVAYETALYYSHLEPSQFELGGQPYFKILTGIGVAKNQPGLEATLTGALHDMMTDGSYAAIFNKWHIGVDTIPQ
jgi:polar amino acid transport system substrate-binding protein